jgi:hypothetical protein
VRSEKHLLLTEGSKKAIVASQNGYPSVGVFGKNGFNLAWLKHFSNVQSLWLVPDPDAYDAWVKLAHQIRGESKHLDVRVAQLPDKPDDFLIRYGADVFGNWLSYAKRVD